MIQFNLLPDVKLEYIKARRLKRTVIIVSSMIAAVTFTVFVLFFISVNFVKPEHLDNIDSDIAQGKADLQAIPDLAKILTIQNQLISLPTLHAEKPVSSRMFGFIQQLAPQNADISALTVSFDETTMNITGSATDIAAVNTFIDTLKFTTYKTDATDATSDTKAFSEVVLTQFSISTEETTDKDKKPATYTISLKYVPEIFKGDQKADLVVPKQITTRSETEKPTGAFKVEGQ